MWTTIRISRVTCRAAAAAAGGNLCAPRSSLPMRTLASGTSCLGGMSFRRRGAPSINASKVQHSFHDRSVGTIRRRRVVVSDHCLGISSTTVRASTSSSTPANSGGAAVASSGGYDPKLFEHLQQQYQIDDSALHRGILAALASVYGGASGLKVEHLDAFGATAMQDLAASVAREVRAKKKKHGKKKRPGRVIHVNIPHHRTCFHLKWKLGDSLLDLAKKHAELIGEYVEGTCGGQMSCCTCHVYLDDRTFAKLDPPDEAELDMLDLAYEPKDTSRLACQVRMNEKLLKKSNNYNDNDEVIVITIPAGANNVWT